MVFNIKTKFLLKVLGAPHNKRNKEQRIRISTYQKLYIPQYMISDRLTFLFSVPCSFYCAEFLIRGILIFNNLLVVSGREREREREKERERENI